MDEKTVQAGRHASPEPSSEQFEDRFWMPTVRMPAVVGDEFDRWFAPALPAGNRHVAKDGE